MNCILDIFDTFLTGTTEGGQWELVGYSLTVNGPYGAGGNWPWSTNVNDHVNVDFTNVIQGYYRLNYFMPGDCGGQVTVTIPVVGGGLAGTSTTITLCADSSTINIADELGATFDQGILQAAFQLTGTGVSSAGYTAGAGDTPLDDTFDPSAVSLGTYVFTLVITPQTPIGYNLDGCDQCQQTTATLTVVVAESTIAISLDECWLYVDSVTGCSSGTLELERWNGSNWIGIIGASFPYQVDQDTDWRVRGINCDCSTAVSNTVTSSGCCVNTPALVIQQSGCFLFRSSGTPCTGGTYLWWKSCDNGQTWQDLPFFGDTDSINTNDDCWYQLIRNCPNGCEQRSNILMVTGCAASCNGSLQAVANGCNLQINSGVNCGSTGTFTLQQDVNGNWVNVATAAYGGYPQSFPITENGTYRAILDCDGDSCPPFSSSSVVFTGCESSGCNSVLSVSVNECTITATVTNCPSAFFVFKRLGNTVQSGPSNVYNALNNGLHTVEVYNCPDCDVLIANASVETCNTGCGSGISASADGCTITATATNCPSPTYVFKQGTTTLQSGPSNTYVHPTEETVNITVQAIGCPGCSTIETTIQINCVFCNCTTGITNTNCELFANDSNCSGYSAQWRYFNSGTSQWVVKGTGASIVPDANGLWERRLSKAGCPDVVAQINVDCLTTCPLTFLSGEVDAQDCNQILFTYQGATADNVTLILNYNQVGTTCGNAGGWSTFSAGAGSSFNFLPNGTGSGTIVVPSSLYGKCIRLILIDNDASGCPAAEERVFFPECCDATPSIQVTGCAPYTLSVINAPAGATYLWSNGSTASSIQVYNGTFSVDVTDGDCVYNIEETVSCCADPCLTNFESCVHYNWLNNLSQSTAAVSYITRFRVNGSDLIVSPQVIQWSPSVFVPGSSNTIVTNPSLVNTLNALSNNLIAFELADFDDYQSCFNTIPGMIAFIGLLRIVASTCVTSFEIIIDLQNPSPVSGQGDYRYTQNGLDIFNGGSWVDITTVLGTSYMIDNGPCDCFTIDLCA